jgi:eukaryotic-like serine/threonine-protein kinase
MSTERWDRIKQLLEQALELPSERRGAYLDSACESDGTLRAEVESLIRSHEEAGSQFLTISAAEALDLSGIPHKADYQRIGRYRLVEEIGRGGMGQVWLAEQTSPVQRQVALKLIRAGMFDGEVLKRFEMERQSLAIMEHPSIAKVFDAGATPDGQPYFVMEYVPGVSIADYCDQKRLKIRDRLELFIKVCEAVQHAHQKAIIHRDLKPANILVQEVDGKPVPRIIDFGLAKATGAGLVADSQRTRTGSFVGTPGYMSPEQCDPYAPDVDTRTDVYSLGVVLYVLLTGRQPFESTSANRPLDELLRSVREEEPPRPSTHALADRDTSSARAVARGMEPKQLASMLRGDLDWITLKALEKDRNRRYGTAVELAADLSRYLRNEPVTARPASFSYRVQKYVRRHRAGVAAVVGLVLLLAGFGVMQTIQLRRTTRERDRANRIAKFMTGMFKVSNPMEKVGETVTAREILDKASTDIGTELAKDPEMQAVMMQEMGEAYLNLGLYSRAQQLFEKSIQVASSVGGAQNPDTLTTMETLAWTLFQQDRLDEAERTQRKVLDLRRRVLGPEDADTLAAIGNLSNMLDEKGDYGEAEKMQREVLEKLKRIRGPENSYTLASMDTLATILSHENRLAEAEELETQTLAIERRVFGTEDLMTIHSMMNEAVLLGQLGRDDEAENLLRQTLEVERRVLGPDQPEIASTIYSLGTLAAKRGQAGDAFALLTQAVDGMPPREAAKIGEDPDLKALHGDPRFDALVAHAKARTPAQAGNSQAAK